MLKEIIMPKLGMTMKEGLITKWEKKEGDFAEAGDILFSVTTDKVNMDVEMPENGYLIKIIHEEWDNVTVGDIIAWIGNENDLKAGFAEDTVSDLHPLLRATPAARAYAKKRKINIDDIHGTGLSGRILRKDVEKATLVQTEDYIPIIANQWEDIELTQIQKISSERMTSNFMSVPHFYLTIQADVTEIIEAMNNARANDIKATFTDVLVWMLSRVIIRHPKINASYVNEKIRVFKSINIGIAANTSKGLLVPVIHNADKKSFIEIVQERARLISLARENKLLHDDISGGTFTLSNLGMYEINSFQAIINSPESTLLSVGEIIKNLVKTNEGIVEKPFVSMSLSCDHRVLDGVTGARFLKDLKMIIKKPSKLLDENLF
jgi:pyruvate dehydrogenase E2 component (dihydrolipoamide acetyltransferase)